MFARRWAAPILLAGTLLLPATLAGQVQLVTVEGVAIDSATGAPIVGAYVMFPQLRRMARSDSTGHFKLARVPAGTYTLSAGALGYGDVGQSAELREGTSLRLVLPPHPLELAAIQVAVDSLDARRLRCVCWKRLDIIVLGPKELASTSERTLRRMLESMSWKRGHDQMTYHFAAQGRVMNVVVDELGWGATPHGFNWLSRPFFSTPRGQRSTAGNGSMSAPATARQELDPGPWAGADGASSLLDWFRPEEIGRLELYRVRGSTGVGIRLYTPEFLLRMQRTTRGLDWICTICPGEGRQGSVR